MSVAGSVRIYIRIHPRGFLDTFRLFSAYAASLLLKIIVPSHFHSVGLLIPGRRNLRIKVEGTLFEVRPRSNDLDLVSAKYEPLTKEWFQVSAKDVVIDVGSHVGGYALMAARRGAIVFAIEPEPSNFAILRKNVELNHRDNVVLLPYALSSSSGTVVLSPAERWNTGTSAVESKRSPSVDRLDRGRNIRVPSKTLDDLVEAYGLRKIDWLKVDVEGHEVEVLEGGASALRITQRLILEVTEMTKDWAIRLLDERGFDLIGIENGNPASNLLFARKGDEPPHAPNPGQALPRSSHQTA